MFENNILYDLISRWSARRLITWIIYSLVGRSTSSYIRLSNKAMYYKPMALLIQYKLIENLDCIGWFEKLTEKVK